MLALMVTLGGFFAIGIFALLETIHPTRVDLATQFRTYVGSALSSMTISELTEIKNLIEAESLKKFNKEGLYHD